MLVGRIQRTEHEFDTVSEGQSYVILFSVFTENRDTLDLIYDWTEKHISRKNKEGDHFLAWHWEGGGVSDWMPASDTDCDYAFALLLASYRRMEDKCAAKAIQIINDILDKETVRMSDNHLFCCQDYGAMKRMHALLRIHRIIIPLLFTCFTMRCRIADCWI